MLVFSLVFLALPLLVLLGVALAGGGLLLAFLAILLLVTGFVIGLPMFAPDGRRA